MIQRIDSANLISADRLVGPGNPSHNYPDPKGTFEAATFLFNCTAITRTTGTLTIHMRWTPNSNFTGGEPYQSLAFLSGIIAPGLYRLPLDTGFNGARHAIPAPNLIIWDLIGDTTNVSGEVWMILGR